MLRVAEEFHGTHPGRQRRANEDALYARAPLFAVADGMGGAQAGEIAARIAVETLGDGLPAADPSRPEAAEERLAELIRAANDRIHELSRSDDRRAGMGTTMTAALVGEDDVTIAHVGDSRAYLLRDGKLTRLTRDHSLVEELVQQGKLTPEEAGRHPQRSVITRAVGPESHVDVDTQTSGARDGDVFLICSDGLTSMVAEDELLRVVGEAPSLEDAGRALIDAANDAGGRDNITVVLFRLEDVGHGGADAEQDTMHGEDDDLRTGDVHAALEAGRRGDAPRAAGSATVERARPEARRLRPLAPTGPGSTERRPRWMRRLLVAVAVIAFVVFPLAFGGFIAVRSVYFIGVDEQGFVTVYRGLPYELPLGIDLYQENYVSPIPLHQVPPGRRDSVTGQQLRSQSDAYDLVRQLELGQVQGTR